MNAKKINAQPAVMVIFGASGDLTQRKLVPALHSLACENLLPADLQVIGVARTEMTEEQFRAQLLEGVEEYARLKLGNCEDWPEFARRLTYLVGAYDDPETYGRLVKRLESSDRQAKTPCNRIFYLATPPTVYTHIIEQLGRIGLNDSSLGWTRIIVEKPFGHDLKSAQQLNNQLHTIFREDQVYRIDHYLGKETVQNILSFRFANTIFEPLWNRNYVDHVQISMTERIGVGHRAGYYDESGVVRDMVQNHLLQLVTLTALEPPVEFDAKALRDEKVKVLRAIRPLIMADTVWGQYRGYREEPEVRPDSTTPTYIALRLLIDNWRWQGVPFYLRSGKNLARKSTEITLQFKQVPHMLFAEDTDLTPNRLTLCIQPDEGMHLCFETKVPGAGMRTEPADMEFHYDDRFGQQALPEAYERLLIDALQGDASLFARSDEIEHSWALITPLLRAWESQENPPLAFYEPQSEGPVEADTLMARTGRAWMFGCDEHLR